MKSGVNGRNSETLKSLSTGFTLEKRFDTEFEKLEKIGRGGFASVYKVRNILDNSHYAIKKIKISIDKKNKDLQKEISSVLQEIRYLAKFKCDHVVTYNHSWVEVNVKEVKFNKNKKQHKKMSRYADVSEEEDEVQNYFGNNLMERVRFQRNKYETNYESANSHVSIEFVNSNYEENISKAQVEENFQFKWDEDLEELEDQHQVGYAKQHLENHNSPIKKFKSRKSSIHNSAMSSCSYSEQNDSFHSDRSDENFMKIGNKNYYLDEIESISIFIQMELCNETLGDYLEKRNKKLHTVNNYSSNNYLSHNNLSKRPSQANLFNKDNYVQFLEKIEDLEETFQIFDKILAGVEYIHKKENLLHRDLKPNNIFFINGQVKIGDLGLATNSLNKKCEMMCPSPILERSLNEYDEYYNEVDLSYNNNLGMESSFRLEIEENETSPPHKFKEGIHLIHNTEFILTNEVEYQSNTENNFIHIEKKNNEKENYHSNFEVHTSNIGTSQYAAPEQLGNIYYDNKVDIYSLGLVLLELFYPFKTRMEKHEIQENLKVRRVVPSIISEKFPKIGDLIISMTESDPLKRPNICQCRFIYKNIIESISASNKKRFIENFEKLEKLEKIEKIEKQEKKLSPSMDVISNGTTMATTIDRSSSASDPNNTISSKKTNTSPFKEKRKRFMSEDISNIESYKLQMRNSDSLEEWKNM
jgi:eukaryotic translation initiation factor 2-alpha kinase 1